MEFIVKRIKNVAFLILISFLFSNLNAGKKHNFRNKGPDTRQQKKNSIQAARYLQRINEGPTERFEQRHPQSNRYSRYNFPRGKRALFVFFMFMILIADVTAQSIPQEEWPSTVHRISDEEYEELDIFGPCQNFNGSKICCDIGTNYNATCYATNPHRYVSFDVGGIIGDQPDLSPIYMSVAFNEAKAMCAAKSQTNYIANEAEVLFRPRYLQNLNSTIDYCTIERFKTDSEFYEYPLYHELGNCTIKLFPISEIELPSLVGMADGIAKKFNWNHRNEVEIVISDFSNCFLEIPAGIFLGTLFYDNGSSRKFMFIGFSDRFLLEGSDLDFFGSLGHEVMHVLQQLRDRHVDETYDEIEADMASVFVTGDASQAVFFSEPVSEDQLLLPILTRENVDKILVPLNEYSPHPSREARISFILTIYKHYKKALELLMLTANDN